MFPLALFKVHGESMAPSIEPGSYAVVSSLARPKAGDVVVARHPFKDMRVIKRVKQITEGRYFLEGDNKDASNDSSTFGTVDRNAILGKVLFVL